LENRRRLGITLGIAMTVLCGCGPEISDIGYVGTWQRPLGEAYSRIGIWEGEDGEFHFAFRKEAGEVSVRCHEEDLCSEYYEGQHIYDWGFDASMHEESGQLVVRVDGVPRDGRSTPLTYTDRIELRPGGLELWSWKIEQNGQKLDKPTGPLQFAKVSNDPFY